MKVGQILMMILAIGVIWWFAIIWNHGRPSILSDATNKRLFVTAVDKLRVGMKADEVFRVLGVSAAHVMMVSHSGGSRVSATISWSSDYGMDGEVMDPWVDAQFALPTELDAAAIIPRNPPASRWEDATLESWTVLK